MSDETPKVDGRGKSPGSLGALRPPKEGEPPRNPKGVNGWDARRQAMVDWLDGKSASPDKTRIEQVRQATYTSSLIVGPKGAADRKLLWEQYHGKALLPVNLSGEVATGAVLAYVPDNGRVPGRGPAPMISEPAPETPPQPSDDGSPADH